jgi:hypothetical protein
MNRSILATAAMTVFTSVLCVPAISLAAPKLSPEAVIDQFFRSDVPLPGSDPKYDQVRKTFKVGVTQWLGNYQGVQKENDRYLIEFEHGQVPVTVVFKQNGDPDKVNVVGCPITSVPISQAPSDWHKSLLANCSKLKP